MIFREDDGPLEEWMGGVIVSKFVPVWPQPLVSLL